MTKERILVFIPMYNCEKQIPRVVAQFVPEVQAIVDRLIIVNNRSTDSSENTAIEAIQSLKGLEALVLRNQDNYGLGGSHKVAFDYSIANDFTHIIVLHGDDQGSIENILPLLKEGRHRDYDCLLGARFHPKSRLEGYSAFRTFGNNVYNTIFSAVCGRRIYDLGSGLNMYDVRILNDGFFRLFPDDLTFNYYMALAHTYFHHRFEFFPITWRENDQLSNVKLFNQAMRVLRLLMDFTLDKEEFFKRDHRMRKIERYTSEMAAANFDAGRGGG